MVISDYFFLVYSFLKISEYFEFNLNQSFISIKFVRTRYLIVDPNEHNGVLALTVYINNHFLVSRNMTTKSGARVCLYTILKTHLGHNKKKYETFIQRTPLNNKHSSQVIWRIHGT